MKKLNKYIKESILDDEDVLISGTKKHLGNWLLTVKNMLEQELYDMLDVIAELYDYAGCGVNEKCRNA